MAGAIPSQCASPATREVEDPPVGATRKLASHEDFRVRTQAALALGASASAKARKPLCGGLGDESEAVRAASAAALGRLKKGGVDCLKKRQNREKSRNVKKMLANAIRFIEEAAAGPAIGRKSRIYIAIAKTTDKTGRGGAGVDPVVRQAITSSASAVRGSVLAPRNETPDQAKKVLRKHKHLEAFLLEPVVSRPSYGENGELEMHVEILIYSYPNKSLQGNVTRSATVTGISGKDTAKENQLIEALCKAAMEHFAQLVAQLD